MTMTLTQCGTYITLALGGGALPSGLTNAGLVNQAGRWLTQAHQWQWLARPLASLTLVASQSYVELPADFGELIATPEYLNAVGVNANGSAVELTTLDTILSAREQDTTETPPESQFYAAVVYEESELASSASSGAVVDDALVARLEIWPTPSDAGSFKIAYRAAWSAVASSGDVIVIPNFMEPLFIEVLRAFARGAVREDDDMGTLSDRLQKIVGGAVWAAATRRDATAQPHYGPLAGGAAVSFGRTIDFRMGGVGTPS